ncbi:MAG TPA: thioredoxin family protein, partial [Phycisphaerae bacterium]|nr:thioredoxin family protein [Phycisphaerae bacterium]
FCANLASAEEPFVNLTLDQACAKAATEKKVVMIDFYTVWCGPCKMLDRNTWPNEKVRKLLTEKAISLKVDAEKNRELSQKYRITSYPQIVFLKPDGSEIDRLIGYRDAEGFLREAAGPLIGKDSLTLAKEAIDKTPGDPMLRIQYGDALAQRGKAAEALNEYTWCLENWREQRNLRNTSVIPKIAALGRVLPQATATLAQHRARALALLAQERPVASEQTNGGPASRPADANMSAMEEAAATLVSIDRAQRRPNESVATYDQLKQKGDRCAEARRALAVYLIDVLWSSKRYEDMVRDCGDPLQRLAQQIDLYNKSIAERGAQNAQLMQYMKQSVTGTIARLYEALLGTGNDAVAMTLAEELLKFDGSGRTYSTLMTHAARSGRTGPARELANKARATLKETEYAQVQAALNRLPPEATAIPTSNPAANP